jgi:hypothetical protein
MRAFALLSLLALGCIDTRVPPDRLPQATISYGPRMILVDETRAGAPNSAACTRLTNVSTSTFAEGVEAVDGKATVFRPSDPTTTDRMVPHNCFIQVTPRELRVDRVEVTNELFQLCIDSGACDKPDPSKAGKGPLCNDEDEFDVCPLVEVTQSQASNFCNWVGRRLPSGLEHIAIRQQNIPDRADPVVVADYVYPTGNAAPNSCDQAVLAANSCLKPRPVDIAGDTVTGAAPMDAVTGTDPETGAGGVPVYDLMGNVSEWTADLHPVSRGPKGDDLPWFCLAALSEMNFSVDNPPLCPATAKCVYGSYVPYDGAAYGVYPVCITSDNGTFSGTRGSLFGGSYRDETTTRDVLGTFGRRVEAQPEDLPDTQRAREFGIRCVGQRDSAVMGGTPPAFDDEIEVLTP